MSGVGVDWTMRIQGSEEYRHRKSIDDLPEPTTLTGAVLARVPFGSEYSSG